MELWGFRNLPKAKFVWTGGLNFGHMDTGKGSFKLILVLRRSTLNLV
uniref:Uncharacterized protein n=1 Tax=Echinococcus granulosus TaxID=6210 RepID=A0A068WM56_ECHGR|nr:hypothetical protein EgrG_000516000 [Echinococcus granulosus]